MSLADHVRTLGRGPGRSRSLTQAEAADAMRLMLDGRAESPATGALLMLLRMKGETADEIAGFAAAARNTLPDLGAVALDWPSYAAGRTRGLPWFLLSARLVAASGHPVLLHGWNGPDPKVREGLGSAGIAIADTTQEARDIMARDGIAYLPLETLAPDLFDLLMLRDTLGLRSCINTVCRMFNPAGAQASVQGVFHPSYRLLQADAAALLGWEALTVIKGGGGEFERNPSKDIAGFGLRCGALWTQSFPATQSDPRRLDMAQSDIALSDVWLGTAHHPFAEAIVIGTAALALDTLRIPSPMAAARDLWAARSPLLAA